MAKIIPIQKKDKTHRPMVINKLLQLNLGSKVQIIAYADDLAIHGGPIGHAILYNQMTTALKKVETGPQVRP